MDNKKSEKDIHKNNIRILITSTIILVMITVLIPIRASASWSKDNNEKWYYLDSNGVMKTGVIEIEGVVYLLGNDGELLEMLGDTTEDYSNLKEYNTRASEESYFKRRWQSCFLYIK